jgi:hypothetical protein
MQGVLPPSRHIMDCRIKPGNGINAGNTNKLRCEKGALALRGFT